MDAIRLYALVLNQVHDFAGEHARLARSGTGNYKLRPVAIGHCGTLLFVKFF